MNSAKLSQVKVPDVTGYRLSDGERILKDKGFSVRVTTSQAQGSAIIIVHEPVGGQYCQPGKVIEILAE